MRFLFICIMEDFNIEIFEGKSYRDLLRDINNNANENRKQIYAIINELRKHVQTISDVVILAPIIQSYLDTNVKNDDQLVKMASIIQRLVGRPEASDGNFGLTEEEKNDLLNTVKGNIIDISDKINTNDVSKQLETIKR